MFIPDIWRTKHSVKRKKFSSQGWDMLDLKDQDEGGGGQKVAKFWSSS